MPSYVFTLLCAAAHGTHPAAAAAAALLQTARQSRGYARQNPDNLTTAARLLLERQAAGCFVLPARVSHCILPAMSTQQLMLLLGLRAC